MQVMDLGAITVPYGYRVWFLKFIRLRGALFDELEEARRAVASRLRQRDLHPGERSRLQRLHRIYLSALYEPELYAIIDGTRWEVGQWSRAVCRSCRKTFRRHEDCPFDDSPLGHSWGFYSFHELQDALEYMAYQATQGAIPGWASEGQGVGPMFMAIGISLHAGKIWEGTRGLRSTRAYAYALLGPDEWSVYVLRFPEDFHAYYPSLREIPWRWPEVWVLPCKEVVEMFNEQVRRIRAATERYVPIGVGMPGATPRR